jgi:hypothetical protein
MIPPRTQVLASEYPAASPEDALLHVIPGPLESTVSYWPGDRRRFWTRRIKWRLLMASPFPATPASMR